MLAAVLGGTYGYAGLSLCGRCDWGRLNRKYFLYVSVVAAFLGMLILKEKITKPVWIG